MATSVGGLADMAGLEDFRRFQLALWKAFVRWLSDRIQSREQVLRYRRNSGHDLHPFRCTVSVISSSLPFFMQIEDQACLY